MDDFCLRDVFGPPNGRVWFSADYSQLERILAVLAKEEKRAFEGQDIHTLTADSVPLVGRRLKELITDSFMERKAKLEAMTGVKNFDKVFKEAPGIGNFMDQTSKEVNRTGCVRTISGYKLGFLKRSHISELTIRSKDLLAIF